LLLKVCTDIESTRKSLQELYDKGFRSIAICLLHSYTFPSHELAVCEIAESLGFTHISLSSRLSPTIRIVPRGNSSTADAYLTPEIKRYIEGFERGFEDLRKSNCRCEFMQSDGGLVEFSGLSGLRAILSGPAGGCVGYARTAYVPEDKKAVIGFDMGGTSTDVSRYGYPPVSSLTLTLICNTKGSLAAWSRYSKPQRPESLFKAPS
jgi:5-oxoprolinase (ATP-hydrolysing)